MRRNDRILALDYGDRHIGVAVSDPLGSFAMPLKTIIKKDPQTIKPAVAEIGQLIKEYEIGQIVVGHPVNMDDSIGPRAVLAADFSQRLRRNFKRIPILLWDERLSTQTAREILSEQGIYGKDQKAVLDQVAASVILQDYMDWVKREKEKGAING